MIAPLPPTLTRSIPLLLITLIVTLAAAGPPSSAAAEPTFSVLQVIERQAERISLRIIVISNEATAKTVGLRLSQGEKFSDIAAQLSKDASKHVGGWIGWVVFTDLNQEVRRGLEGMQPRSYTDAVLLTNGTIFRAPVTTRTGQWAGQVGARAGSVSFRVTRTDISDLVLSIPWDETECILKASRLPMEDAVAGMSLEFKASDGRTLTNSFVGRFSNDTTFTGVIGLEFCPIKDGRVVVSTIGPTGLTWSARWHER